MKQSQFESDPPRCRGGRSLALGISSPVSTSEVDLELAWDMVQHNVPQLREDIEAILAEGKE